MAINKILVVDDSKTELMYLTDLLVKNGFEVKTAENAEDAFRRLAEEKPELILMDVVMPGQNGFQLTRAITRDPLYADIPIMMCTSKNQETDRVWGMRQGARDYITKPVEAAELLAKIKALG
ncbi:MAG: response regulator [Comamonadaceae bacterium]|nr:MAG: response regulator [Comamonadaceae bacterium]